MIPVLLDYETLRVLWWLLLGLLLIGFAITDVYDLGMAALLPWVGRDEDERKHVLETVEPVWEGNQVWLITGGAASFAAWPPLYGVSFSGFYLAMFLVLLALILRPVGFGFRSKIDDARWRRMWDIALIVGGIVLVAGLVGHKHRRAPGVGVMYGLLTGAFIAAYTVNDGWAVKVLLISPFLVDFTGNLFRMLVLAPRAWRDRDRLRLEARVFRKPVIVVSVLGPLGYILVLFAMRLAPVSHVAPARELSTLVGAWFGSRLLREDAGPWRVAGAALIVAGVVCLAWRAF